MSSRFHYALQFAKNVFFRSVRPSWIMYYIGNVWLHSTPIYSELFLCVRSFFFSLSISLLFWRYFFLHFLNLLLWIFNIMCGTSGAYFFIVAMRYAMPCFDFNQIVVYIVYFTQNIYAILLVSIRAPNEKWDREKKTAVDERGKRHSFQIEHQVFNSIGSFFIISLVTGRRHIMMIDL